MKIELDPVRAPRLLTEHEAAAYLRISKTRLARWRGGREGPPFIKIGRTCLYDLRDLADFADQRKQHPARKKSLLEGLQ